jgi:hypothetical protein
MFQDALGVKATGDCQTLNAYIPHGAEKVRISGQWLPVEATAAEVISVRYQGLGAQAPYCSTDVRECPSPEHAAFRAKGIAATQTGYGKGKIIGVYGAAASNYFNAHHPFLRHYLGSFMQKLFPNPMFKTDAPPCVDFGLTRSQDGSLCVHLLNLADMPAMGRRAFPDRIPPTGAFHVTVALDKAPSSVRLEPKGSALASEWREHELKIAIPNIDIYEIIVIER